MRRRRREEDGERGDERGRGKEMKKKGGEGQKEMK
jgi:hypothetical protein